VKYRPPEVGYADTSSATESCAAEESAKAPHRYSSRVALIPNGWYTYSNTHTAGPRYQPTPHGRSRPSSIERVGEGRGNGGEQAADADREGKGRQVAKFPLQDRLIAKLCRQFRIVGIEFFEVDNPSVIIDVPVSMP